ncbi:MAG: PEP-CTERM sorting domain-containing protein [Phycisphaerae bacterium]|nr:PEP-CTERM sorting domain-containing protein [Phycisphaerae bacterium]
MNLRRSLLIALMVFGVASANAGVVAIGEFAGDLYEGFEGIGSPGGYQSPLGIMGGAATVDDSLAHTIMIAYSLQSGLTGESIYPYNGNLMGGSVTGWFTINFTTPVVDFGGFFGTADDLQGSSITFKDAGGAVIDSMAFPLTHPQWTWYGWHSDTPIATIDIHAAASPGLGVTLDDFRANVPEPSALGLLLVGIGLVLRRR